MTTPDQTPPRNDPPAPRGNDAPTPAAQQFVEYLLGFGVSVAIGLAPFLGRAEIPGFTALLSLIPNSIQDTVIPLSAILMGFVALLVEWFAKERASRQDLAAWFRKGVILFLLSAATLLVVHTFTVVKVPFEEATKEATFIVGFGRPDRHPCPRDVADAECIKRLTFDPAKIDGFWGDRQIRLSKLSLMGTYLVFTSCFAALVGLLVVRARHAKRSE